MAGTNGRWPRSPMMMPPPCCTTSAVRRSKRAMANQTKHLIHTMFEWAKQPGRKFVTVNPFADLPAPGGTGQRARFLSAAEIRQSGALRRAERFKVSRDAATALRLILVTAARPGWWAASSAANCVILPGRANTVRTGRYPAARMKAGSTFITPLSGLALQLLRPYFQADPANGCSTLAATICTKRRGGWLPGSGWNGGHRTTFGAPPPRSSTVKATRSSRSARCTRHPQGRARDLREVGQVGLRREMAMVLERSLRETLGEATGSGRRRLNYLSRNRET